MEPNIEHRDLNFDATENNRQAVKEETIGFCDLLFGASPFFCLQVSWTVQQVFGLPFLSSLGFSDAQLPALLLSGPLAGFLVPPILAAFTKSCGGSQEKQRRSLIIVGGIGVIISLPFMAFTEEFSGQITRACGVVISSRPMAAIAVFVVNICAQCLHLGLRSSVVAQFQPRQQPVANLCISRFSSLGSVLVTLIGTYWKLSFRGLALLAAGSLTLILPLSLILTLGNSSTRSFQEQLSVQPRSSFGQNLKRQIATIWKLPPVTKRTCRVQFLSWFAWFLILNYSSLLISQEYTIDRKTRAVPTEVDTKVASQQAIYREALIFHVANLATIFFITAIWRPDTDLSCSLTEISTKKILTQAWRVSLMALTGWLLGIFLFSSVAEAVSLILGAIGLIFSLANWIPYTLISTELSGLHGSWEGSMLSSADRVSDDSFEEDTAMLLAVHNMAINFPQIVASVVIWGFVEVTEGTGKQMDVALIFLTCIPATLLASLIV